MTICYHPWVGLDISPQGEFKPCCKYTKVLGTTIEEYETNPELEQLRQDFLNGVKPKDCGRCWRDESAGLPSKRTLDNEYVFKNTKPDLSSLKVVGMPFGNTCNLACRTCDSYSSSRWAQESKKLVEHYPVVFKHSKFYQDPTFMNAILNRFRDVIRVEIHGGEPFYADFDIHYEFLSTLSAESVSLHYTTNGTTIPDSRLLDKLKSFKHVDIQLSIDGETLNHFEYTRWPAKWQTVTDNVKKWQEFYKQNSNIQLSISHTVSIFTVFYLPEFFNWCQTMDLPEPYLGLLTRPDYFNITVLPTETKNAITKKLENNPKLKHIINAMAQDDSHLLDKLIKFVKINDVQRNQSFPDTYPELYQLLGEKCQTLYQQY